MKEAAARVKIKKLLKASGWRFFADENGPANTQATLASIWGEPSTAGG